MNLKIYQTKPHAINPNAKTAVQSMKIAIINLYADLRNNLSGLTN